MDLADLNVIKDLCKKYGLRPSKDFSQNFLIDREVLEEIVAAADLKKDDVVLEIGPGLGVLTAELAGRVKKVLAVEADRNMAKALSEIMTDFPNVEIIQEDILKFPISNFQFPNKIQNYEYKVVANLPYQITSAVFRKFLSKEPRPSEITVMVQKEVAERISAKPGEMSLLSLSVQFFGRPEIAAVVPRTAFWPKPEVDSAILRVAQIKNESEKNSKKIDPEKFFKVVKIGFSARRKQLHNNLSGGLRIPDQKVKEILISLGFDERARAQDLGVNDWIGMVNQLNS
jgi:16S rRNA (adenine1518-N6/adenine1519-N6)-dimethyltransferase